MNESTPDAAQEKECGACGETKPLTSFSSDKRGGKITARGTCKPCVVIKTKVNKEARRLADPAAFARVSRNRELRRWYGITIDDFDRMLADQGGRCAACGTDKPDGHNWNVDHDHATGRVRGILCWTCNVSFGHLGEDVQRILALAAYAQRVAAA